MFYLVRDIIYPRVDKFLYFSKDILYPLNDLLYPWVDIMYSSKDMLYPVRDIAYSQRHIHIHQQSYFPSIGIVLTQMAPHRSHTSCDLSLDDCL